MKWLGRRSSGNLEDRRGMGGGLAIGGGIIGVIVVVINLLMGGDVSQVLDQVTGGEGQTTSQPLTEEEKKMGEFMGVLLADNEDVWNKIFAENGWDYEEPNMVLFTRATQSGCGSATSSVGPFYCPLDKKVYMDLAFFNDLQTRFGAKGGDFAIAYVVAHEIGHHVQNLLGTAGKVRQAQEGMSEKEANKLSVALELQADFYAGVWAHHNEETHKMLEPGDIEEALSAASAVGDDQIQKRTQGQVVPDAFTHGTSAQRVAWFKKGFQTGDIKQGNTFE